MSTLKTNTIQHLTSGFNNIVTHTDGAGTVNAAHARAWVNFDGTGTPSIRANFNVSSITDNGTGDYTVNFSNALADANYTPICTQADGTSAGPIPYLLGFNPGGYGKTISITTTGIRLYSITSSGGVYDALYNYLAVFR
jgi:hypothetical protein